MLKEYDGLPDVGSRYVLECRCKKIGEDGSEIGACDDTVNPVSGFIYAENEEQAVNYGIDFIMKYAGDNLLLEDNSILLLDDNRRWICTMTFRQSRSDDLDCRARISRK